MKAEGPCHVYEKAGCAYPGIGRIPGEGKDRGDKTEQGSQDYHREGLVGKQNFSQQSLHDIFR